MQVKKAKRQAVPLSIAIASPSGFGKTYSALLMAAGIAGPDGKVGFIDTEKGRGSMYADDADLLKALPQGYNVLEIEEPFEPAKYITAIKKFAGYDVLVIDSATHEWEGSGGCQDIAENNKLRGMPNWAKAKLEHKRFMNTVTQLSMHGIYCLRAREKTKPMKNNEGKIEMVEMGMQPICEKNFMFDMTVSMMLDENHKPIITKCPKPLLHLFQGDQALITKNIGTKLRNWADGGESIDKMLRSLKQETREAAMCGNDMYNEFKQGLDDKQKAMLNAPDLKEFRVECKSIADEADRIAAEHEAELNSSEMFNNEGE